MATSIRLGLGLASGGGGGVSAPLWATRIDGSAASFDLDFANNRSWDGATESTITAALSCSRALAAYYTNAAGVLSLVATNTLRFGDLGLLVEETRTNVVLQNRDLTNAAWTKTNCTAAKDQTGPDAVGNSASSLTATSATATCLQAITLGSSARWQSAYVKRLSGTGTIEMTMDNGTTWTAIVPTASWARYSIARQTLANPTVGFRITTSGDAIAIDLVQNENSLAPTGANDATSPIPTTTVAVTRPVEIVSVTSPTALLTAPATFYMEFTRLNLITSNRLLVADGANNNNTFLDAFQGANITYSVVAATVSQSTTTFGAMKGAGVQERLAVACATNDYSGSLSGKAAVADTSVTLPTVTVPHVVIGGFNGLSSLTSSVLVSRLARFSARLSNTSIRGLTEYMEYTSEGDSRSVTSLYPTLYANQLTKGVNVTTAAVSSSRISSLVGRAVAEDATISAFTNSKFTMSVLIGLNDFILDAHSAATIIADLMAYCDARRAAGWYLILCTELPCTSAGWNGTVRDTINAAIRTWSGTHADAICDFAADPTMGPDAAASDISLYPDGIHPSALGHSFLMPVIKPFLDARINV